MRTLFFGTISLFFALASIPVSAAPKVVTIGFVVDGPWERNDEFKGAFEREILTLTRDEFDVRFPPEKVLVGDWTVQSIRARLDTMLADPAVDLIIAAGVIASNEVALRKNLSKPVIAPYVIDPSVQDIPLVDGRSKVKNLAYVCTPDRFASDMRAFRALTGFKRAAVLLTSGIGTAVPRLRENVDRTAERLGVQLVGVEMGADVEAALAQIPADVDAVYVGVLLRMPPGGMEKIAAHLVARKLPSFSQLGREDVERGIMAAISSGIDNDRVTRRVATNVQRILLGEDAGELPVVVERRESLVINMQTARAIGFFPSWEALTEAELINPTRGDRAELLTLRDAAEVAVAQNLALLANQEALASGAEDVRRARSQLFPQITASAAGTMIDGDRAAASFGSTAERQLTVSGEARQLIYAEPVYANLGLVKHLQASRTYQREALMLDTTREALVAYIDILRAKTVEQIRRDNLKLTRSNLELAEVRRSIGVSGPAEVYRWEAQMANDRGAAITASARRNAAEIALNQILNRPLEQPLSTVPPPAENPLTLVAMDAVIKYLDNPWAFRTYRLFMVNEGIAASPELRAVAAVIGGQERIQTAASRAFWLPTFALQGNLQYMLARGGEGATGPMLPPELSGLISPIDGTNWSLTLAATLPLFQGMDRFAALSKAEHEVAQKHYEQDLLRQRIEQRIRTAIHIAGASYANIRQARVAAAAAKKGLEVVRDAYARGALDYLNLLDAQNTALVTDLLAANAVYDFLRDQMEVERATSRFGLMADDDERAAWTARLAAFFADETRDRED